MLGTVLASAAFGSAAGPIGTVVGIGVGLFAASQFAGPAEEFVGHAWDSASEALYRWGF